LRATIRRDARHCAIKCERVCTFFMTPCVSLVRAAAFQYSLNTHADDGIVHERLPFGASTSV
jgi:hypothetical protein